MPPSLDMDSHHMEDTEDMEEAMPPPLPAAVREDIKDSDTQDTGDMEDTEDLVEDTVEAMGSNTTSLATTTTTDLLATTAVTHSADELGKNYS